jgi:hypothetical protein
VRNPLTEECSGHRQVHVHDAARRHQRRKGSRWLAREANAQAPPVSSVTCPRRRTSVQSRSSRFVRRERAATDRWRPSLDISLPSSGPGTESSHRHIHHRRVWDAALVAQPLHSLIDGPLGNCFDVVDDLSKIIVALNCMRTDATNSTAARIENPHSKAHIRLREIEHDVHDILISRHVPQVTVLLAHRFAEQACQAFGQPAVGVHIFESTYHRLLSERCSRIYLMHAKRLYCPIPTAPHFRPPVAALPQSRMRVSDHLAPAHIDPHAPRVRPFRTSHRRRAEHAGFTVGIEAAQARTPVSSLIRAGMPTG